MLCAPIHINNQIAEGDNIAVWRDASGYLSPARVTIVTPLFYEVDHNGRLKTSSINRTRLINTNLELDTAHPATHQPLEHIAPTINDLQIQDVHSDTDDVGDVEISTSQDNHYQVFSGPSLNHDRRMPIRQTEVRRVDDEAKALIPYPIRSTRAWSAAAAEEVSIESPPSD